MAEGSESAEGSRISLRFKEEMHNLRDDAAGTSEGINPEITLVLKRPDFRKISGESVRKLESSTIIVIPLQHTLQQDRDDPPSEVELCEFEITPPPYSPLVLYSAPPVQGAPPTYSAILRIGPADTCSRRLGRRPEIRMQPSPPFIAPIPPPSYAEAQGLCLNQNYEDSAWGPEPVTVFCPTCNNFVITNVRTRRSNVTHFSALALCICGCWPCCLLPYCMKSCKTTYHECPLCVTVIGIYNPWMRRMQPI
ncbi:PREDICTED: lipopolysaccharide-induced tumor necrosis factor-alpha factor homolog isoform X2 [Nicrophorus vespilloides]|uniref:Lipopolysaccharide-induced tumor necrosis factor-alpha factor homolog isoform X2 n=1 Tax=Nicrophorus vespilloides TaxID=110193 RepID=A0ABM1MNP2_NICVS|nr:PREDICTED: lipopolysaccharide-induced tumor necrosis factor-alpha factor homolog isoform X2 [Nicrophorus vespilloides]